MTDDNDNGVGSSVRDEADGSVGSSLPRPIEKVLRRLEEFHEFGRVLPEFPELPYREVVVPPYRFFYRVKGEIVGIAAVWQGAQFPDEPMP